MSFAAGAKTASYAKTLRNSKVSQISRATGAKAARWNKSETFWLIVQVFRA